jgi:hypothetical protein
MPVADRETMMADESRDDPNRIVTVLEADDAVNDRRP